MCVQLIEQAKFQQKAMQTEKFMFLSQKENQKTTFWTEC